MTMLTAIIILATNLCSTIPLYEAREKCVYKKINCLSSSSVFRNGQISDKCRGPYSNEYRTSEQRLSK